MATEITMPKLSDTMTEGTLISWKKSVGERVERGDVIAEVETDKANMELEAFTSGVLLETRAEPGDTVPVGTVIALVGKEGEKPGRDREGESPAGEQETAAEKPEEVKEKSGKEDEEPEEATEPPEEEKPETEPGPAGKKESAGKGGEAKPLPSDAEVVPEAEQSPSVEEAEGEVKLPSTEGTAAKASPLVRRLAREQGIDLTTVRGSGPDGRILREDMAKAGTGDQGPGTGEKRDTGTSVQPLSRMRRAIARTVAEAWRTIPHFAVTVEVEMGEAERVRQELKGSGTPVSLNDIIVKAAATAIGAFPRINASFTADGAAMHPDINIGIVVALDDGLLVPVITGCETLSLKEIATRSRGLIKRAKNDTISEGEISGGTFTVSNLGMFGVDQFWAVIHPPQGAILAVGAVADRPVIRGGHLAAGRMMHLTLSADHRLIDGAYAAKFLRELKRILENPVVMLV
jgi:pyruvate dehydrogenase E2 component (dihydrolipoamide acetyltransferase)